VPAGGRKGSRGKAAAAAADDGDSEILDSTTDNDSSAEQHRRVPRTTRGAKAREIAETARPRRELGKKSESELFLKRIQSDQKKQYPGKYADGDSEDDDTEDSTGALKRRGGRRGEAATTTASTKKATRERLAASRALKKQQQQAEAETETETEAEEKQTKRGRPAGKASKKEEEKSSKKTSKGGARKRDSEDSDRDAEPAAATTKGSKAAAAVKEEKGQIAGPGVFVPGRFLFADTANDEDEELKMELAAAAAAAGDEDNGDKDSAKKSSARSRKPLKSKKAFVSLGPDTTFSGHLDTAFGYADCHNPATIRLNALRPPLSKAAQARKIETDGAEPTAEEVSRLALEKLRLTLRQTGKLTGFSGALLGLSGVWLKPLGSKHRPKTPAWDAWLLAARGEGSDSGKKGSGNQQSVLPPMPSAPPALALTELSNALDQTESAAFSRERDYLSSLALVPPSPPSKDSDTNASEGMVVVQLLVGKCCSFSDLQKRFVLSGPSRVLKRALDFKYSHGLSSAQVVINALIMQQHQHQQQQGGVYLKLPAAADVDALLFGAVRLRNQSQKQAHCCQLLALEEAATRPVPASLIVQMAGSAAADTGTTDDGATAAVRARPGVLCFDALWTWQPCFVKFVSLLDTVCALLLQQRLEEEYLSGAGADKKPAEKRARVAVKSEPAAAPAASSSSYRSNEGAVEVLAGAAVCLRFHAVFMTRAQAQEVQPAAGSSNDSSSSSMDVEGEDEEDIMMGLCDDSSSTSAGARSGSTSLYLVPRLHSVLEAAGASAEESFFLLLMEMCKLWRVYNSLVRDAVVCEAEHRGRGRLISLVSSCLAAAGHVLSRLYFMCHDMKEVSGASQGVAVNAVLHKANKELDHEELLGVATFCSVGLAPLSPSSSSDNDYSSSSFDADDAGFGGAPATVLFLQRLAAGVLHGPGGHLGPADGAHGSVRQAREQRAQEVLAALNMELFSRRLGGAVM
jgi:hypothetical protein